MLNPSLQEITRFLLLAVILYLGLLLFLYLNQDNLIYMPDYPSRKVEITPDYVGLAFERVSLSAEDGVTIDGWFLPHPSERATLLFFHGNAGNISHRLDSLKLFHNLGLSVLIIDYRGYGRSEGKPNEAGIYRDAEAAWHYLVDTRQISADRILLFGRSFGGAVAAYLASKYTALGLVLESTFTSAPEMAAQLYPWLPARWLTRFDYDTRGRLTDIHIPLLVIHSRQDDIIPFSHGEALYAEGRPPKRFFELKGSHNYGVMADYDRYRHALDGFIDLCLTQKPHLYTSNSSPE
jgi:fermentation-respiration switch protein FrsA (DUF1100 family)